MSDFKVKLGAEVDISSAKSQLNSFLNSKHKIKIDVDKSSFDKLFSGSTTAGASKAGQAAGKSFTNAMNSQLKNLQQNMNNLKFDSAFTKMDSQLGKYSGQQSDWLTKAKSSMDDYKKSLTELQSLQGKEGNLDLNDAAVVSAYERMSNASEQYKNAMVAVNAESDRTASSLAKITTANQIDTWAKNNTKAVKEYGDVLNKFSEDAKKATTTADLSKVKSEFAAFKSDMSSQGLLGNSFSTEFGRAITQIGQFAGIYGGIQKGIQTAKQMVAEVIEIDSAMTNLKKVTDETDASYSKFLSNAGKASKELGSNISSYVTQVSEWAKLGNSISSSETLARTSMIYSNVGEVDDKTAVGDLVTAMKAFNITGNDSITIVDSLNALSNKYAVSAAGLGEGLKNSASALAMQGNSMEQVMALLTGGGEITQDVGGLGNALKVTSLRLASMKGSLSEIGEEYENINSVSKNQTDIYNMTKGQVNILDEQNGKLKNTYTILEEIAGAWDNVDSLQQSELAELLFGKNRANQGVAILQAFQSGQIQKALSDAQNSAGSAQAEQDKWMDSIEAKMQVFKASFQDLSQTLVSSDFVKGAVEGATALLDVLTQIVSVGGGLPAIFAAIGGVKLFKNLDWANSCQLLYVY